MELVAKALVLGPPFEKNETALVLTYKGERLDYYENDYVTEIIYLGEKELCTKLAAKLNYTFARFNILPENGEIQ